VIAGGPFFVQYEPSLLERAMNEKWASRRRNPSDLWNNPRSWITQGNPVIPTKTKQGSSVIAGGPFFVQYEPSLLERAMNEKWASRRRNPSDLWNNPRSWITQGNPVIPTKTKQGSSVIAGGPFFVQYEPSLLERAMNEKWASRRRNPSDLWNNPRSWITQGNPVIPTKTKQGSSVIAGGPFLMCKESKF
jgi:hypothetical protein